MADATKPSSTQTTMDADAKAEVKKALLAAARAQLRASEGGADAEESAAELDQDSSFSVDDQSQADEAGAVTRLFEAVSDRQQDDVVAIETLDVAPTDVVRPGAIVGFGGARYVVGVVSTAVRCGGESYEGLSTDSPIYAEIEGLHLGDSFTFRDTKQTIDFLA